MTSSNLASLSSSEKQELHELLQLKERRRLRNRISRYYPAEGPLRRELYQKHLEFFRLGATIRERLFIAANRIGKTEGTGGYEVTMHLTGQYPDWWEGRRFDSPVECWAANDSNLATRDIIQTVMLGPVGIEPGTGLIPGDLIINYTAKSGVPDGIDTVYVKHASGGTSILQFKSFEQGRKLWQGTKKHVVWFDEEPPFDVYTEGTMRTASTAPGELGGLVMCTFTPMLGMSEVVLHYLPDGKLEESKAESRRVVQAGWDDVPHLSDQEKQELLAAIPLYQRKARSQGIPMLGSGAIYPVDEDDFVVDDFVIPDYWPKGYGFDVGWNATAGLFGALDRANDILYLYSEYKRGKAEPEVHAAALKPRAQKMNGFADPAARASNQKDGSKLMGEYIGLGLNLMKADNAVEAGLFRVYERLTTGRLKIFRSLRGTLGEMRMYRRDEDGKVVKANDHLMDCLRYLVAMLGYLKYAPAVQEPIKDEDERLRRKAARGSEGRAGGLGWMGG